MKTIKKDKLEYLVFENMPEIKHCFSTRYGGVSEGAFSSMNLAWREDKKENVLKNYDILCNAIGVKAENTVWTRQVHTDNILRVTAEDRGKGLFKERQEDGYDAIMTNEKDVVLVGFSADCVLIYFYDKVKNAIAIAHSGWRGTVLGIGGKVVKRMKEEFGSNPEDIVCGIAPAIGVDHFQVDIPVVTAFRQAYDWADKFIYPDENMAERWFIDLHSINEEILVNEGIKRENIENSRICTQCDPDRFFSHRVMGAKRGTLAGYMSL